MISRHGGMVYDDVLNITWAPANLWGQRGNWDMAVAWADQLVYEGFDDWRLASMSVSGGIPTGSAGAAVDCSSATEEACRDNELGYMYFYNLTPAADNPPTDLFTDLRGDQGLFTDIESVYWSGTEFTADPGTAWRLPFGLGLQGVFGKFDDFNGAWAVRAGDVAAVPLSGTVALAALGLFGLSAFRFRERRT